MTKPRNLRARSRAKKTQDAVLAAALTEGEPTPERRTHGDIIEAEETMKAGVVRNRVRTENMLDRYLNADRPAINQAQHDAGMKFYQDWRAGGSQPRITGSYGTRVSGNVACFTEHQLDAQTRVTEALRGVGTIFSGILIHVCLCNEPAKGWASANGEAERTGVAFLRKALDALYAHYQQRKRSA